MYYFQHFSPFTNFRNSALKDLQALDEAGTPIDFAQLQEFLRFHQALLSPLFQLHTTLRAKILGVQYWDRLTAHRAALSEEQQTAVNNFISKVHARRHVY